MLIHVPYVTATGDEEPAIHVGTMIFQEIDVGEEIPSRDFRRREFE